MDVTIGDVVHRLRTPSPCDEYVVLEQAGDFYLATCQATGHSLRLPNTKLEAELHLPVDCPYN